MLSDRRLNRIVKAVNDLEVREHISSAPFYDWYSSKRVFESTSHLKPVYKNWLLNSTNSKIEGLDTFENIDFTFGITQSLDDLLWKHKNQRLRIYEREYHYTFRLHQNYEYLENESIKDNDWVLISVPFCFDGNIPKNLDFILDECYENNVPVYIDAAFYALSYGITLDLSHPAIKEVYFSLSKSLGMGFLRTGLKFSKQRGYSPVSMQNDYNYSNLASILLGEYVISKFNIDHTVNKYYKEYEKICEENNLIKTSCIHIALSNEKIDNFLTKNNKTKVGIWHDDEHIK